MDYFIHLAPEIYQLLLIGSIFVVSILNKRSVRWIPWGALLGVAVCAASMGQSGVFFYKAYQVDALSQFFKLVTALGFLIVAANSKAPATVEDEKRLDWYLLLAISAFGLMLLASAVELITMILCLEISSFSLYALVPLRAKSREAAEAGIKYILFGAAASALALLGYSFILAGAHTSYLALLKGPLTAFGTFGMALFLSVFFFKLALVPFHFWAPDVYTGAGNETASFIATLPKLGAMVVLIRVVHTLSPGPGLTEVLAVFAAVSITYGNLAALVQTDVKRILGYSSIAHAGYILVGLVAGSKQGLAAAAFYSLAYMLMNLTCFWVVCRVAPKGENVHLQDLAGLHRRAPMLAFVLAVGAFALVGLPPTAGFTGKLFLLTSAWGQGFHWLVIVAAVNTAFSLFYYLNLVRYAYTAEEEGEEKALDRSVSSRYLALALASAVLLLGMLPASVYSVAMEAALKLVP